jgi:hypothetical protein
MNNNLRIPPTKGEWGIGLKLDNGEYFTTHGFAVNESEVLRLIDKFKQVAQEANEIGKAMQWYVGDDETNYFACKFNNEAQKQIYHLKGRPICVSMFPTNEV